MLHRIRNTWLAGGGALLLVLSMSGLAGAANLVTDTTTGTPLAFVDVNGNGIADTCETGVVTLVIGAPEAALAAADLNGDGDAGNFPTDRARRAEPRSPARRGLAGRAELSDCCALAPNRGMDRVCTRAPARALR